VTQFVRLSGTGRPAVAIHIDGAPASALSGDTVLTALLVNGRRVREGEFGEGPRAGFCAMGACQDCWVFLEDGSRLRACTTPVAEGMHVLTRPPALPAHWPAPGAAP